MEVLEQHDNENMHKIPVKEIKYPNLDFLKKMQKRERFSVFDTQHMKYASELIKIFDAAKDKDELISLALYIRDQINCELFVYGYSCALQHRPDTYNIPLPQLFEIQPHKFFQKKVLIDLQKASSAKTAKKGKGKVVQKKHNFKIQFEI